ncbi:MAG: PPC domain-containing DNA-binding protein [Candidatus Eisenbacteria bacterium]
MEKNKQGDLLVVRFADGEDLMGGIEKVLTEEGIFSGIILGGVGMVKNAALSFYIGHGEYESVPLAEEAELCSLNGNISTLDGELVIHAHAVVGKRDGGALAGHVSGAQVHMTAEVAVLATPQKLTRKLDSQTGLKTLTLG